MRIAPNIRKGIAYLDEKYPKWDRLIDLDLLDMQLADRCVIGQIVGNFFIEFDYAEAPLAVELGFQTGVWDDGEPYLDDGDAYRILDRRWKAAIRRRRRKAAL